MKYKRLWLIHKPTKTFKILKTFRDVNAKKPLKLKSKYFRIIHSLQSFSLSPLVTREFEFCKFETRVVSTARCLIRAGRRRRLSCPLPAMSALGIIFSMYTQVNVGIESAACYFPNAAAPIFHQTTSSTGQNSIFDINHHSHFVIKPFRPNFGPIFRVERIFDTPPFLLNWLPDFFESLNYLERFWFCFDFWRDFLKFFTRANSPDFSLILFISIHFLNYS